MRWLNDISNSMHMSLNKLQEIFLTQGLNQGLPHCRQMLYCLSYQGGPYMATGKTIALTIWTFVGKVTSLLFNTLSKLSTLFLGLEK